MAVGPVTLNGVIPRSQDISVLKQQEDSKPFVDQQNIKIHMEQKEIRQLKQVNHPENADQHQKKYDAKEKGSNEYNGQHGQQKKRKTSEEKKKNQAIAASIWEGGRFDMKI